MDWGKWGMVVEQCSGGRGASPPHQGGWGGGGAGTILAYIWLGHTCAQLADRLSASFNPTEMKDGYESREPSLSA
jgi:hypothetical protein